MKRIVGCIIVASICWATASIMLMASPGWGVTEKSESREILRRQQQALQETRQGKSQQAIATWKQVLSSSKEQGRRDIEANALLGLGVHYNNIGQRDEALYYYNESAYLHYILGDKSGSATALNNMGLVYKKLGEEGRALELYNLALRRYREAGDKAGEAIALQNIGGLYKGKGKLEKALSYYNQASQRVEELGNAAEKVKILKQIAGLQKELGQASKALSSYKKLLLMSQKLAD